MRVIPLLSSALIALALGGCMQRQPTYYMVDPATGRMTPLARNTMQPAYPQQSYASVTPNREPYTLDAGDKLRIVVFGQDGITNSYIVGADGQVNLPLVGNVAARGSTTSELASRISERLKQGYVREPHVSVEVDA